jgi:hypothetical protein
LTYEPLGQIGAVGKLLLSEIVGFAQSFYLLTYFQNRLHSLQLLNIKFNKGFFYNDLIPFCQELLFGHSSMALPIKIASCLGVLEYWSARVTKNSKYQITNHND